MVYGRKMAKVPFLSFQQKLKYTTEKFARIAPTAPAPASAASPSATGPQKTIRLTQADFSAGTTVFLQRPYTRYVLVEDVIFRSEAVSYAIGITVSNVTLDLGGHSLTGDNTILAILVFNDVRDTSILNGTIKKFRGGVADNGSTNLKLKCLNLIDIGTPTSEDINFAISGIGLKNFLISRCRIDNVASIIGAVGIGMSSSGGKIRKCSVSNVFSPKSELSLGAIGIQILSDSTTPQQISNTSVTNISGASATGLLIQLSTATGALVNWQARKVKVKNIAANVVNGIAIGVEIISARGFNLYDVHVETIRAIVDNLGGPNNALGFDIPSSNVKFVDCSASDVESLLAPAIATA